MDKNPFPDSLTENIFSVKIVTWIRTKVLVGWQDKFGGAGGAGLAEGHAGALHGGRGAAGPREGRAWGARVAVTDQTGI